MRIISYVRPVATVAMLCGFAACGGGKGTDNGSGNPGGSGAPTNFTIGGSASGLVAGQQVTLANGSDTVAVSANGAFTFAKPVTAGSGYAVIVSSAAPNERCTVSSGSGAGVNANVNSVVLTCSVDGYAIGGTISGLASGQQVTLRNNGADALAVAGNGAFTFPTPVAFQGGYLVTVGTQPTNEVCSVAGGSGTGSGVQSNVASIALVCATNSYAIGGQVTGLIAGQTLTLKNNGADPVTITSNSSGTDAFTFATAVAYQGSYAVTVGTQPTNEACSVAAGTGSGSGVSAGVTTVALACSVDSYLVGGKVTGLANGQRLTLLNNGADPLTITGAGTGTDAFTFPTRIALQGGYAVTVSTQPANEACSVAAGSGASAGVNADVTTVSLACAKNSYAVSGSVSGLAAGQTVTILDNGADATTITGGGSGTDAYAFSTKVAYLGSYAVTVSTQPANEVCSVSAGTGSGVSANVATTSLACSVDAYGIGGTVTGLASGLTLTLVDNAGTGGNTVTLTGTGAPAAFTFPTQVAYRGSYVVTVGTQPVGQFCSVSSATGSGITATVSNVAVGCVRAWYVSGTGLDTHDGKTAATAFRTLGRPAAFVQPGDVVLAMNGTYTNDGGGAVLGLSMAGTADAWITYRAYPGHTPTIQTDGIWGGITFGSTAQYLEVNGFTVIGDNLSLTLAGAQAVETDPGNNPSYNGNCIAVQPYNTTGVYPHHLRILNNTVSQCPGGGIATISADYVTISGNTIYDTALYSAYGCSGISTLTDYDSNPADKSTPYKMIITNNIIYGNQELIPWGSVGYISDGEGIIIDSNHNHDYDTTVPYPAYTGRTLIANNVVYGNGSAAIEVYQSSHVDVVNNSTLGDVTTPTGPSAAVAHVSGRGEMNLGQISDVNVYNNIFYSLPGQNPITQSSTCADCNIDYNLYYGGTNSWNGVGASGAHDKVGNPLYANTDTTQPASVSLRLRTGSPAIDNGASKFAPSTDINGNPRPSASGYSMGAYSQ